MRVVNVTIIENKRAWSMIINCKKCKKDLTSKTNQMMINSIILSGKTYTHSDNTKAEYKKVKLCECYTI